MSYRQRSRSPSPRAPWRYSPSRPLDPSPPRRPYSPPPRPGRRRADDYFRSPSPPLPPSRRFEGEYQRSRSPPPRRSPLPGRNSPPPPRRYTPPSASYEYDTRAAPMSHVPNTSASAAGPSTSGRGPIDSYRPPARDFHDSAPPRGMAADREERYAVPPPRRPRTHEASWERGRDQSEFEYDNGAGMHSDAREDVTDRQKGKAPGEPSRDVIFLGLDAELTENDLMSYLRSEYRCLVDSVKIVRDRGSGQSKHFGFAQFASLEGAEDFINANFPAVLMPALYAHSNPKKVKIDFSAPLASYETTNEAAGLVVHQYGRPPSDGMRDIGVPGGGKRTLLLRGLDYHATPGEITNRLCSEITRLLRKPGRQKEAENCIVRIVRVVDRQSTASWGYGFVELVTAELANALLPFLISPVDQPQGLMIHGRPVAVSFVNAEAFQPVSAGPAGAEYLVRASTDGGLGSEASAKTHPAWVAYWHEQASLAEHIPTGAHRLMPDGSLPPLTTDQRIFLGHLGGPLGPQPVEEKKELANQGLLDLDKMAMQPITISLGGLGGNGQATKKAKLEEGKSMPTGPRNPLGPADDEGDVVGQDTVLISRMKGVSNVIAPSKGKVAKDLARWGAKRTELGKKEDKGGPPKGLSDANAQIGHNQSALTAIPSPQATDDFDYTDLSGQMTSGKVACLLCQRQFPSEEKLRAHVARSDLHKARSFSRFKPQSFLITHGSGRAGQARKLAAAQNTAPASTSDAVAATTDESRYRDRAAERRAAFNQPDRPSAAQLAEMATSVPITTWGPPRKRPGDAPGSGPAGTPSGPSSSGHGGLQGLAKTEEKPLEPAKDEKNVGNQLLAKMGWSAGEGLGREGEGRLDPIQVRQFEERAGLGRGKGVEAGKYTGVGGQRERGRDLARDRYDGDN